MVNNSLSIIEERPNNKNVKLFLKGPVSSSNAEILQQRLEKDLKAGWLSIILNMQDVSILASGGIRILLMYHKIFSGRGISFYIEKPSESVKNVIGMVALDEMLLK